MWEEELSFFFFLFNSAVTFNLAVFSASLPEMAVLLSHVFKTAEAVCLKLNSFGLDRKGL